MHSKGIFKVLVETLKDSSTMIVLKYHLFMTIRELIERDCVEHLTYAALLQDLIDPISNPNNQVTQRITNTITFALSLNPPTILFGSIFSSQ